MKTGFSMLLQEYVPATEVLHKDCEHFQIVCPECREPVFKVEQDHQSGERHFLSHYKAALSHAGDCELRVGRLDQSQIAQKNTVSRDQKLSLYLEVLRGSILRALYTEEDLHSARADIHKQMRKPHLSNMFQMMIDTLRGPEWLQPALIQSAVQQIFETRPRLDTPFARRLQARIATDVWNHLLTSNAQDNLLFLFCAAWYIVPLVYEDELADYTAGNPECSGDSQRDVTALRDLADDLWESTRLTLPSILAAYSRMTLLSDRWAGHPPIIAVLMAEIDKLMLGTIAGLPYEAILREKAAARSSSTKSA